MNEQQYDIVIGLEVHVQMKTASKMFCGCDNDSDGVEPNTNVCPVCLGHPGTLPVLNDQAVEWGMKTALALNCEIPPRSKFDRKNYFYPDLPKGYQISQYDEPIGVKGHLLVQMGGNRFRVGIHRLHLEEDAGKLMHLESGDGSLVDFNRAGTPLMEIVSEPDIKTPQQARAYLEEMRQLVRFLGVSDADMEKGHLRCDANISLRPMGDPKLYPKTEIKNVNSFRSVERALQYEISRQTALWEEGQTPEHATRGWDDNKQETVLQRTKEEAADYRYFPEPDIPMLTFSKEKIEKLRESLPELPDSLRTRLISEYRVSDEVADLLASDNAIAAYFEDVVSETREYVDSREGNFEFLDETDQRLIRLAVNWMTTELFKYLNAQKISIQDIRVTPENFAELLSLLFDGRINSSAGQTILHEMLEQGRDPSQIAEKMDLIQMSDEGALETVVNRVIESNAVVVENVRQGKGNAIQFLVGQVMKETKGKANPGIVQDLLRKKILG